MPKEQKTKSPSLASMGLVALDVVIGPESNHVPQLWAGGTCGNVTAILNYLGWTAFPLARLGKDFAARFVSEDLKKWKVRLDYVLQDLLSKLQLSLSGSRTTSMVIRSIAFRSHVPLAERGCHRTDR